MNRWFSIRFLIEFREASTLANSLFGVIARGAPEIEGTNGSIESSLIINYFQEKEILLVYCGRSPQNETAGFPTSSPQKKLMLLITVC